MKATDSIQRAAENSLVPAVTHPGQTADVGSNPAALQPTFDTRLVADEAPNCLPAVSSECGTQLWVHSR